jgi:uncharacterized membrane protein YvbJ
MKFCGNCGQQLHEGQKFCPKCGKNLMAANDDVQAPVARAVEEKTEELNVQPINSGQAPTTVEQQPVQSNNLGNNQSIPIQNTYNYQQSAASFGGPVPAVNMVKVKTPRKPMALGVKIAIGAIILIVLAGGGAFGLGTYLTSEGQIVKNIEKAINEGNAKELVKYLYSSEEDMKLDEASTEALIKFINEDEAFKEDLIERLAEGRKFESFSMTENGKTLFIFKKFVMEVEPQYLKLSSNYEGVDIKLNGASIGKSQKDGAVKKYGPFMPGSYKLEFVYENEFGRSVIEKEVEFKDEEFSTYAEFNLKTITGYASIDGLKVSVDGKETKVEVGVNGSEIGPFAGDKNSTLVFSKNYPWGNLVSIDYNSNDMSYDCYVEDFKMKESDFVKSAAPDIKAFLDSYYTAKSSLVKDLLVNATDNCKSQFESNNYWSMVANYMFKKAYINVDVLYVGKDNNTGRDIFTVYAGTDYTYNNYDYKDTFTLTMYYDEAAGKWMVDNYSTYGYLDNAELMDLQ